MNLDKLEKELKERNKNLENDIQVLKDKSRQNHPVHKLVASVTKPQTVSYDPLVVDAQKVDKVVDKIDSKQKNENVFEKLISFLKIALDLVLLARMPSRPRQLLPTSQRRHLLWLKILLIFLILATGLFSFYFVQGVFATTEKNFIALSQNCLYTKYDQNIAGGSVISNTASGCNIVREIKKVGPDEPVEVKYLLEGKKMVCHYNKGEFDETNLNYMSTDLDHCEGELKDILVELNS